MGLHAKITADTFPKQSSFVGKTMRVCFHYDTSRSFNAECVRDDQEDPGLTIFKLSDGRYVLSTECMYQLPNEGAGDQNEEMGTMTTATYYVTHQIRLVLGYPAKGRAIRKQHLTELLELLPPDAVILRAYEDLERGETGLVVESLAFEAIPEAAEIPRYTIETLCESLRGRAWKLNQLRGSTP